MKKKVIVTMILAAVLIGTSGCGAKKETEIPEESLNTVQEAEDVSPEAEELQGEAEAFDTDELFTGWLPEGTEQLMSETEVHEGLRQALIAYYDVPEDYWEETRYYYNYVDLDGDGDKEIFAVAMGSFVSGSGGGSALWCKEDGEKVQVLQAFTLINTPILVVESDHGVCDLYLQRSGGGAETEIVKLTCKDGAYTSVSDAEAADGVAGLSGTAIICNDMIEDMENETYLTLADES